MPEVEIACPTCGEHFTAEDCRIGQVAECEQCGAEFEVRLPEAAVSPPEIEVNPQADGAEPDSDATLPVDREMELSAREDEVPAFWHVGDTVLDLYEVKDEHKGGMGLVYKVRHKEWNLDLAVKTPRPEFFDSDEKKEDVERECETWINLGLHPNTVSCHYVHRRCRMNHRLQLGLSRPMQIVGPKWGSEQEPSTKFIETEEIRMQPNHRVRLKMVRVCTCHSAALTRHLRTERTPE